MRIQNYIGFAWHVHLPCTLTHERQIYKIHPHAMNGFVWQSIDSSGNFVVLRIKGFYASVKQYANKAAAKITKQITNMLHGQIIILTHWGRLTHICVDKLTIICSDNGLSPGRRQTIIWTNDGISLIRTLGTNFNEILHEIHTFSFKKCIWICRLWNGGHFVSASIC